MAGYRNVNIPIVNCGRQRYGELSAAAAARGCRRTMRVRPRGSARNRLIHPFSPPLQGSRAMKATKAAFIVAAALACGCAWAAPVVQATLTLGNNTQGIAIDPAIAKAFVTNFDSGRCRSSTSTRWRSSRRSPSGRARDGSSRIPRPTESTSPTPRRRALSPSSTARPTRSSRRFRSATIRAASAVIS